MTWIKRNLFFVIGLVVGLALTGFCAYLLINDLGDSQSVNNDLQEAEGQYHTLQNPPQGTPYPSDENIALALKDQETAKQFLADSANAFGLYPPQPKVDERGFKTYLEDTLAQLRKEAKDADVALPEDFCFAFTEQEKKLNYAPENLQPWMQQLTEIKGFSEILFNAKINSLQSIKRSHVSESDFGNYPDYVEAKPITNGAQIVTPYIFTFKGFSREIASVLLGLAQATNYYIVVAMDESISRDEPAQNLNQGFMPMMPAPQSAPPPAFRRPGRPEGGMPAPPPVAPTTPTPYVKPLPVTILSERVLRVQISMELVKSKGGGH